MPTPSTSKRDGDPRPPSNDQVGDPDCPHCHGLGYLRLEAPMGHPDFGRLEICVCRQSEVRTRIRERLFSLSHLEELRHLTFETFHPKGRVGLGQQQQLSLEQAFEQCRSYARSLDGWLLLSGGYGAGKTHLAAAIANECVSLGVPTLFLTVPDLLDSLRAAYDSKESSFEETFDRVRQAPLLILDDFGTHYATEWAQEKLFQILNYRYINRLPLVVTTNLLLDELEGRIRSRLSDPDLVRHVRLQVPDYRRPVEDTSQHELSSLDLHADQRLGNFNLRQNERMSNEERRSLDEAFRLAREFAEKPEGWLVIVGPHYSGKTHLAAAIGNQRSLEGHPIMFVAATEFLNHLRATFSPESQVRYDKRFEEVRKAPLLILDDLGGESSTPWAREKLYELLDYRFAARLPTVITSAQPLDKVEERLRLRMQDARFSTTHAITAPPFRGGRARTKRKPAS
ncbi:MAG TPA: ATP-binding protein [Anaerolineales bacterium]|nr:ATP-binding protein [Anaerolineales bacterium]